MRVKKVLALLLAVGMTVGCLAGCGSSKGNFFTVASETVAFEGTEVEAKISMDDDLFEGVEGLEGGISLSYKGKTAGDSYDVEMDIELGDLKLDGRLVGDKETVYVEKDVFETAFSSIMGMVAGTSALKLDLSDIDATYIEIPLDEASSGAFDTSAFADMKIDEACTAFGEFFASYKSTIVSKDGDTYKFTLTDDTMKADAKELYKALKKNPKKMGESLLKLFDGLEAVVGDEMEAVADEFREAIEDGEFKEKVEEMDEDDFLDLFNAEGVDIEIELTKKGKAYTYVVKVNEFGGTKLGLTFEATIKEAKGKIEMPTDTADMEELEEFLGGLTAGGSITPNVSGGNSPFIDDDENEEKPVESEPLDFDKNVELNKEPEKATTGKGDGLKLLYAEHEFNTIDDVIEDVISATGLTKYSWSEEYSSVASDYVSKTYEAEDDDAWYSVKAFIGSSSNDFDFTISWEDRDDAKFHLDEYTKAVKNLTGIDLNDYPDVIKQFNKIMNGEAVEYDLTIEIDDDTDCGVYISDDADGFGTYMSFDFYHYFG